MGEGSQQLRLSLIKQLSCCSKTTRGRALRLLLKYLLPSQTQLSEDDMENLWKGLFYCVWHSEKLRVQSALIDSLSSLLLTVDLRLSIQYFSVFLLTMRREWTGIDALRMDKFYLLTRRFMHNFFFLMKKNSWDLELTKRLMCVLEQNTFFAEDKFNGNGVNYHVASVFLEELKPFLPVSLEVLEVLFTPFIAAICKVPDKILWSKIKSNMFDVLLTKGMKLLQLKKSEEHVESADDYILYGTIALVMGFSKKFFDSGSSPECCQGNRKFLFALNHVFLKLEKDLESSGLKIVIPDVSNHMDVELPNLTRIVSGNEVDEKVAANELGNDSNADGDYPLKKFKKTKEASGGNREELNNTQNEIILDFKSVPLGEESNDDEVSQNSETSNSEQSHEENYVVLDELEVSNLKQQFEMVGAEAGLENEVASAFSVSQVMLNGTVLKKRTTIRQRSPTVDAEVENSENIIRTIGDRSTKTVKFCMKNNLVWSPHTPLPPQSLRLPPSATPKGSALKKGVPLGPIREAISSIKKKKRKARKPKALSPATKRVRRLKACPLDGDLVSAVGM